MYMHVNTVHVNDFLVSYDIQNVESKDKNSKKESRVELVATFTKSGEKVHAIYNLGGADEVAKLLDSDYAKKRAMEMIEQSNKSKHSPFLQG